MTALAWEGVAIYVADNKSSLPRGSSLGCLEAWSG